MKPVPGLLQHRVDSWTPLGLTLVDALGPRSSSPQRICFKDRGGGLPTHPGFPTLRGTAKDHFWGGQFWGQKSFTPKNKPEFTKTPPPAKDPQVPHQAFLYFRSHQFSGPSFPLAPLAQKEFFFCVALWWVERVDRPPMSLGEVSIPAPDLPVQPLGFVWVVGGPEKVSCWVWTLPKVPPPSEGHMACCEVRCLGWKLFRRGGN